MTDQIIHDYTPSWAEQFLAESGRLVAELGGLIESIEHIGSTSVPGLPAKPLIDMMAAVSTRNLHECVERLTGIGYSRDPGGDFEGRAFLRRLDDLGSPTHHLSLTERRSAYWCDQLAFRDALRADPKLAAAYAELKRRLALEHGRTIEYTRAKTEFVRDALLAAGHQPASGWASEA